jgi:TolA-binding protein
MEEASVVEKEVAAGTKNSDSMLLDKVEMRDEKVKDEKSMVTQLEKALEEKSMPALSENQPVVVDEMQPQKIGKNDEKAIFKESDLLRQALESLEKDDYSTSMLTFQKLEHSSFPQIQVRAKFYIGEVLFKQKEFDLALQVYEEIIKKYAFSGMIVKALERSKACSQELKLDNKFEKYQSLYALLLR